MTLSDAERESPSGRLLGGTRVFHQPPDGYRAAVDGLLLAAFAGGAPRRIADLGAGAGCVTLAVLARAPADALAVAVERDAALHEFLSRNVADNGLAARVTTLCDDVEHAAQGRRAWADLVLANPPYYDERAATPPAHPRARAARIGRSPLGAFVRATRLLLGRGGRACFVWPAASLADLVDAAARAGLVVKRARFVHPLPDRPAIRVLAELKPGRANGLTVEPPLVLHVAPGVPSAELLSITGPPTSDAAARR